MKESKNFIMSFVICVVLIGISYSLHDFLYENEVMMWYRLPVFIAGIIYADIHRVIKNSE